MLTKILIGLAVLIVVLLIVIALQPSDFRITRTTTIAAAPSKAFELVNDFHQWSDWSPWEKIDPALQRTYEGSTAGTGAIYSWVGNSKVGEGRMTITESRPAELVLIKLEFIKPFACVNTTEFTFKPEGSQTVVTWTMSGKNNFMAKAFGLVMNMDKMIGGDFEKGLSQMKTQAEAAPKS